MTFGDSLARIASVARTRRWGREIFGDTSISRADQRLALDPRWGSARLIRVRNAAAMVLAGASGATDAIGYLALGHVFTSAMTGNLVLLGISLAHRDGERVGRVLVSLVCFMAGAALGARVARSPEPDDPVWPSAVTRALAIEAVIFVGYAACWWTMGPQHGVIAKATLLGLGAIALGIQSAAMQRFGPGLNTTFLSGSLTILVGSLATGHRFRDIRHHLLVLVGLVCGGLLAALLVVHSPAFAPLVQLVGLAAALCVAGWQALGWRRVSKAKLGGVVRTA
jgi:uncharacterized membrane protein YoaK (UPF0700 family)